MLFKIKQFEYKKIDNEKILEIYQGWQAYARWADTFELRKKFYEFI